MPTTTQLGSEGEPRTRELLDHASEGDDRAWEILYQRYRVHLLLSARGHLKDRLRGRVDEEDIVQSAFLAAWDRIRSFEYRGENSFRVWLSRIVVNNVFDKLRAAEREGRRVREESAALDPASDPSAEVARAEERLLVLEALAALPEEQRDVLVLRKFEHKRWAEVADVLECSEDAARRRYRSGLSALAKGLAARRRGR